MNQTVVLILEDSRKVGFGGGQKGSLEVASALQQDFDVQATDSVATSLFAQKFEALSHKKIIRTHAYGSQGGGNKASFSIGILELLYYPFLTLLNFWILAKQIRLWKKNSKKIILYAPLKKNLIPAWFLAKAFSIPYLYHARNFDHKESIFYPILRFFLRDATYSFCVSKAVLKNLDMPNCRLLYNPIKAQEAAKPRSIEGKSVITVAAFASLFEWKGLDDLLKSREHLQSKNVRIQIYGHGPQKAYLESIATGDSQILPFTNQVEDLLRDTIDIICMPSISEEAFGRVPMEGYSFGIPAITTNIGAQAEITVHNQTGFHVDPHAPEQIAQAIDRWVQEPSLYAKMSQNALQHSKAFDLEAFRTHVCQIFKDVEVRSLQT